MNIIHLPMKGEFNMNSGQYEIFALNGGKNPHPCKVLVIEQYNGLKYYVEKGGLIVNMTYDVIDAETNLNDVLDIDCFSWDNPINTLEELEKAIEA